MFFVINNRDIVSYADYNTYSVRKNQSNLETKLQKALVKLFKWFKINAISCRVLT